MTRPTGRTLRRTLTGVALLGLSTAAVVSLASSALFTDTRSVTTSVTSGSVSLTLGGTASTTLAVSAMAPGDASYGVVAVQNSGSLQARYSARVTWSTANALTAALQFSTRLVADSGATCDGTLAWGAGDLSTDTSAAANATTLKLFGDSATGAQTGDRALAAGTTEYVCVRLRLPSSATSTVAGLSSTATVSFDAEQTANN